MIRPALLVLALAASSGCADRPSRTPAATPIDSGDPAAMPDAGEPIPTTRDPQRIDMH